MVSFGSNDKLFHVSNTDLLFSLSPPDLIAKLNKPELDGLVAVISHLRLLTDPLGSIDPVTWPAPGSLFNNVPWERVSRTNEFMLPVNAGIDAVAGV